MRKGIICLLLCFFVLGVTVVNGETEKGGAVPMLASCCIGPRVGLEMNEGKEILMYEWFRFIPYVGQIIMAYGTGYQAAGFNGFMASCCLGPRVGSQLNERKIRSKEWLILIPVVNLYPWISTGLEALNGKTMVEIEAAENLKR